MENPGIGNKISPKYEIVNIPRIVAQIAIIAVVLYLISMRNYVLFHTLAELFTVVVSFGIFIIAWNSRKISQNNFLLFLGVSYFAVGILDLVHLLAYKNLGVFSDPLFYNHSLQAFLAARFLETFSLIIAFLFLSITRSERLLASGPSESLVSRLVEKIQRFLKHVAPKFFGIRNTDFLLGGFLIVTALILAAIFSGNTFPSMYIAGKGSTVFSRIGEYLVAGLFLAILFILGKRKRDFELSLFILLFFAIVYKLFAAMLFAQYAATVTTGNFLAHLLRFVSFFLIYKGFLGIGLLKPYTTIFRDLKKNEERFRAIVEDQDELVCRFNPRNGILTFVNDAYCKYFGKTANEFIGTSYWDHVPPGELERDKAHITELTPENPIGKIEHKSLDGNGNICWQQWTSRAIFDKNKKLIECQSVGRDITDRKNAEELLKSSEGRLKLAVAGSGGAMWSIDIDPQKPQQIPDKMYLSPELKRIIGYEDNEFPNSMSMWQNQILPEDLKLLKQSMIFHLAGRTEYCQADYRIRHKDGSVRWVSTWGKIFHDKEGKPVYWSGMDWDITEQKRSEISHRENEAKYRSLFSNMIDGFSYHKMVFDKMGRPCDYIFLEVNRAFEKLTGLRRENIIGKRVSEVIPGIELDPADWIGKYGRVATQGEEISFENYAESLKKWFSVSAYSPQKDHFVTIFEDITERKKSEQELMRAKSEWERTFDSVPDLIAIIDNKHRVVRSNKAMAARLGLAAGDCKGMKCYRAVHNRDKPIALCPHALSLRDGKEHVQEVYEPNLGGYFLVSTSPLTDGKGKMIGCVHVARDITERKLAEQDLKKSESRLKRSQEIAHLGSWELDLVENKLIWSDEVYRIFGLKPQEFRATYEAFLEAVHPDDRAAVDAAYITSIRDGKDIYEIGHRIVRPDGEIRFVHEKCEHFRDRAGKIIRSVGLVHDVTERKKAEDKIISIAKFPAENPNPVMRITRDGKLIYANPAAKIFRSALNFRMGELIPEYWREVLNEYISKESENSFDIRIGDRFFSLVHTPVAGTDYVNLYAIDITERRKGEEALQIEKERLKQILESMQDGVYIADRDFKIDFANQAFIRNFGPLAKNQKCYSYIHGRDAVCPWCKIKEVLGGRTVRWELYYQKNKRVYEVIETPMSTPDGKLNKLGILRDITEKSEIEKAKEEFMSFASHQLRTPLTSIGLSSELLLRGIAGDLESGQKEYLEEIYKATKRMKLLVNNLLNVSRLELGTFEVKAELVDIKIAIDATLKEFEPLFAEKKLVLKKNFKNEILSIFFSESAFRAILDNLLSNAVRYTPNGGQIKIELAKRDSNIIIKITDTGCGIPKKQVEKVFEKSFRADNAKKISAEGAGLGLYMVKSIADRTGSKVWFESNGGKGTTFYFSISSGNFQEKKK